MKVICISGKAQHGKDTTAGYLMEALENQGKKVLIAHYGDLVKYVCEKFFGWDGVKDENGRTILQKVGTDLIREQEPIYWVGFIDSILYFCSDYAGWDYVLIPDCRFPNEVDFLKENNWDVVHVRVIRNQPGFVSPLTEEQQKHISETAMDDYPIDIRVENSGTLEQLKNAAMLMARSFE